MILIYTAVMYCLMPWIVARLCWKGRSQRFLERFGYHMRGDVVDVWIHAVSMGEVVAATPLIELFLENSRRVLVTTMTPTGSEQVIRRFGTRVFHQYVPYDLPVCLKRFFKHYQPQIGVIMETELWPNLILEAKSANVSLFLANARISDRAFKQYQHMGWFFKPILEQFSGIFTQSERDALRFEVMGAKRNQIRVLGNMKFDLSLTLSLPSDIKALSDAWGVTRPVLIAASTHEGEEKELFSVLGLIQKAIPHLLLLVAPRHPERFENVYLLSKQCGFQTGRRTQLASISPECEVIVLDSMGELLAFYAASHYAFVGGSWVSIGGHNVLEPIALGVPVLCGPNMQNSQTIIDELEQGEAIRIVTNGTALANVLQELFENPNRRSHQIDCATFILKSNQGTVVRHFDAIKST